MYSIIYKKIFTITTAEQWYEAVDIVKNNGDEKSYIFDILDSFSIQPLSLEEYTFSNVLDIDVIIRGEATISLSLPEGSILMINNRQKVTINDITFQGAQSYSSIPIVQVIGPNSMFIMKGNASITKSQVNDVVFLDQSATLIMRENSSLLNNYAQYYGGGIYVGHASTFTMYGGTIYGSEESGIPTDLANAAYDFGSALYVGGLGAKALYGDNVNILPHIDGFDDYTDFTISVPTASRR